MKFKGFHELLKARSQKLWAELLELFRIFKYWWRKQGSDRLWICNLKHKKPILVSNVFSELSNFHFTFEWKRRNRKVFLKTKSSSHIYWNSELIALDVNRFSQLRSMTICFIWLFLYKKLFHNLFVFSIKIQFAFVSVSIYIIYNKKYHRKGRGNEASFYSCEFRFYHKVFSFADTWIER